MFNRSVNGYQTDTFEKFRRMYQGKARSSPAVPFVAVHVPKGVFMDRFLKVFFSEGIETVVRLSD